MTPQVSILRAAAAFSARVDIVGVIRAVIRQASPWGAGTIRVSSMSQTWLRMHETEYHKLQSDL